MNGVDRVGGRRKKTLKERLGLKGLGCCGAAWGFRPSHISVHEEEVGPQEQLPVVIEGGQTPPANFSDQYCVGQSPTTMNLAAALAAERHYRATAQDSDGGESPEGPTENGLISVTGGTAPGTPLRASLISLLEETTDGGDKERETTDERGGGVGGKDSVCCVCMGRKKGAAFVPCGHTFCRVCSRELWLNRGSCPLCNSSILQILDIF